MKLYVGTYHKYNNGSLGGAWIDLDKFKDGKEFEAACRRLHRDERDPEFMFQDVEIDPGEDWQEGLYSESSIPWDYWKLKAEAQAYKAKAKPQGVKAQREEQERLCAAFTTEREGYTREEHPEAWDKNFKYWKNSRHFVQLADGVILDIEKPSIQTRFCCGEDDRGQGGEGYGTMAYALKSNAAKRTEAGFKGANLDPFDENMVERFGRRPWRRAREAAAGCIPPFNWGRYAFVPCLMKGAYCRSRVYLGNANNVQHYEKVVRYLSDEEIRRMRHAYMIVRTAFKKRLDAYWKRFGASKIHTWTYWTEA